MHSRPDTVMELETLPAATESARGIQRILSELVKVIARASDASPETRRLCCSHRIRGLPVRANTYILHSQYFGQA